MRRHLSLALSILCAACGASDAITTVPATPPPPVATATTSGNAGPASAKPAYPAAPKHEVVDLYRDTRVSDPYQWLENGGDAAVKEWSEAENAAARKWLDVVPQRGAIRARVEQLMNDSSPMWQEVEVRGKSTFALERRPPKQHPFLIVLASVDDAKSARVLVDPNAIDPSGGTAIDWYVPTRDGKRVAVALSKGGAEKGDVHVFDVATGGEAKDVVPQANGSGSGRCLAWNKDGSGFYYTHGARDGERPKGEEGGVYQRVYFHKLGDPVEKDALAVGKDSPRIAQWELESGSDGRAIVARMEYGDGGEFDQWLLGPTGAWKELATKDEGVKVMHVGADGSLYMLATKGAPKGKILRTTLGAPSVANAETALAEGDAVIRDMVPAKTRLYVVEGIGGPSRLRSVPLQASGKSPAAAMTIPTPAVSSIEDITSLGGDDVAFATVSYTEPPAWYRAKADGTVAKTALAATTGADFKGVEVVRESCTSKDGTQVPLTVIRPKTAKLDGTSPTILTGYGGFGITVSPRFRPQMLTWLEQGGVYAVANLRGGGEFGEEWHRAGNLTHKQNVFDDFYACAQHLVEAKYTTPSRLAIQGGSNGGLLMGAEVTQHPEAFKAVVAQVGIFDMLRVERDANGAFNVTEYGSVADPKQFDALFGYSPYHHVKDGVAYPAVLLMTGANDPRVNPYHSRKMTARLQEATSSVAPILLRTSANTGHGLGSPLSAQIEEGTDIYVFLMHELGVTYTGH